MAALVTGEPAAGRAATTTTTGWRLSRYSLLTAFVLSLITGLGFVRRTDPDFWWHLRAGRDMLATGQWPRVDAYSYTMTGQPWVAHEWLWEVLTAVIMDTVGYVGISTLLAGLLLASFGLLYRLLRARGVNEWTAAGLLALAATMSVMTATARPHAVTYLCVITTMWLVEWWRRGRERALWWLVPLMVPWVNVHGGYAIGLGMIGLLLVGEAVDAFIARRPARLGTPAAVLAAGAVAASLNPQGPAIHLFALGFLNRDSAMHAFIQEWASVDFHTAPGMAFAVALTLLALVGLRPRAQGWALTLLTLAFVWLGLQSVRHVPLFALVALPALAGGLAQWRPLAARPRAPEPALYALANWLVVLVIAGAMATMLLAQPLAQVRRAPMPEWYPETALAYLQRERPAGRLFNFDGWGGYLIAHAPDYPVYIDGRTDLYGAAMLEEYRQVVALEPGWRDVLAARGIDLVLVQRDKALATVLREDPGWEVLVEGDVETLLRRRLPGQRAP